MNKKQLEVLNGMKKKDNSLKSIYVETMLKLKEAKVDTKLYLKHYNDSKSARFIKVIDKDYIKAIEILEAFNVPFSIGNDAPRGSKTKDYIIIESKKNLFGLLNFFNLI